MTIIQKEDNQGTHSSAILDELFEAHALSKALPLYVKLSKFIKQSAHLPEDTVRRAVAIEFQEEIKTSVSSEQKEPAGVAQAGRALELSHQTHLPLSRYRTHGPLMGLPFFATAKEEQKECYEFRYRDEDGQLRYLSVAPNPEFGQTDQRDADILRYVLSKIGEVMLRSGELVTSVRVTRYELLRAIGKRDSGESYRWLKQALERLSSTYYKTNVLHSSAREGFGGCLISFSYIENEEGKIEEVEISLTKSFAEAMAKQGAFLAIDEDILKEKSNLRKFLLELVRKHMGKGRGWEISLMKLHERSRSVLSVKDFKKQVKAARLPYEVSFREGKVTGEQIIVFSVQPTLEPSQQHELEGEVEEER